MKLFSALSRFVVLRTMLDVLDRKRNSGEKYKNIAKTLLNTIEMNESNVQSGASDRYSIKDLIRDSN